MSIFRVSGYLKRKMLKTTAVTLFICTRCYVTYEASDSVQAQSLNQGAQLCISLSQRQASEVNLEHGSTSICHTSRTSPRDVQLFAAKLYAVWLKPAFIFVHGKVAADTVFGRIFRCLQIFVVTLKADLDVNFILTFHLRTVRYVS